MDCWELFSRYFPNTSAPNFYPKITLTSAIRIPCNSPCFDFLCFINWYTLFSLHTMCLLNFPITCLLDFIVWTVPTHSSTHWTSSINSLKYLGLTSKPIYCFPHYSHYLGTLLHTFTLRIFWTANSLSLVH